MKRIGGLFDTITDARTIARAAHLAARGKRHQRAVRKFLGNVEAEVREMTEALLQGFWSFGGYREFVILDPKRRTIQAPCFRDRVMHHAILAVAGPVFEKGATERSYACRKGKGQDAALARLRKWMGRRDWFLKIDVRKFYDSVDHEFLKRMLARRFRERHLLRLFDRLLESYKTGEGKGLPIGALTSQFLGNFYLDGVDHGLLQSGWRHVRYMDDFVVLGTRDELLLAREWIAGRLSPLSLEVKSPVILNRCWEGVPFLGFTLYPDRMRLDRRGRKRLRARLRGVRRECATGRISEGGVQDLTQALFAHALKSDDVSWRREVCRRADFETEFREGHETGSPRPARRLVEQHGEELPCRVSQQEQAGQPQQEQRLPAGLVSRHGDEYVPSPDDALSGAADADETMRQSPPAAETFPGGARKGAGGAAAADEGRGGTRP